MHMADALLSPTVGAVMWSATGVVAAYSARKVKNQLDDRKIPLMGVLGAFIFAAQMINFAIPGTGSSGHLGGGLLLAVLLGPYAAFLSLASVLTIQSLFFADGGLLALGCNIFNLGFFPCFIAYPLIFKNITRYQPNSKHLTAASILAALIGLQLGSLGVVLQTYASGLTALPLTSFLLFMQPIHLAIGLVEGIVTAGVISFIWNARPETLEITASDTSLTGTSIKNIIIALLAGFLLTGIIFTGYASTKPDGLEWSIEKVSGIAELESPSQGIHNTLQSLQQKTSFLPDYSFKKTIKNNGPGTHTSSALSGLVGGLVVLVSGFLIGFILKRRQQPV